MNRALKVTFVTLITICANSMASAQTTLCGSIGGGSSALGLTGVTDALTGGPFTCDGVLAGTGDGITSTVRDRESGGGAPTVATAMAGSRIVTAASELGFNHLALNPLQVPGNGWSYTGDSAWGDVLRIVGPAGAASVTVRFDGHLDGASTFVRGDDVGFTSFAIAAAAVGYSGFLVLSEISTLDTWAILTSGTSNLPGAAMRTSTAVNDHFDVTVTLPVNAPIGIESILSSQAHNGGFADFANTGAIDRITLPAGYSLTSNGTPLVFDGSGYHYAVAAVPEPEIWAMILGGMGLLGFRSKRKTRSKA